MNTIKISCVLCVLALQLIAADRPTLNMSELRSTKEGGNIRWIECRYDHWTALACWSHSDEKQQTLVQIFVPGADSKWKLLREEAVPYAKEAKHRIDHLVSVPDGRVFMVIDRSGILAFSYLGYDEEKEPIQASQPMPLKRHGSS